MRTDVFRCPFLVANDESNEKGTRINMIIKERKKRIMNQITTKKTNWIELVSMLTEYFAELGYKNDGFHNSMIFDGDAYIIYLDGQTAGFFSIGNSWDKGKMFRGFYLYPKERNKSMEIFQALAMEYQIEAALVASNDAHFIGLAFEKMKAMKATFDMQAFNFIYGEPLRTAEYGIEYLTEVKPDEFQYVASLTDGQWESCFGDLAYKFYAIKSGEEVLGFGSIGKMKFNQRNVDLGNFTLPKYRRKGIGRSLMIHMSKIALSQGFFPTAGCWYGNRESILTLKSSGFIPENRIFYVRFK